MIIAIEYPITTTGRPARSTKDKTVVFKDTIQYDFPECAASDRGVVIKAGNQPGFEAAEYFGIDGGLYGRTWNKVPKEGGIPFVVGLRPHADVLTSHLEKRLLELGRTLRDRHSTAVATALHPNELAEHFANGLTTSRTAVRTPETQVKLPSFEELGLKHVDTGEVEKQRAAFLAHLSEFVIADGEFLRKVPEPVYAVKIGYPAYTGGEGSVAEIVQVTPPRDRPLHRMQEYVNAVAFFAGNRLDDALAYAREVKAAQGEGPREVTMPRRIEVRDSSYLSFDDERESLLVMAEHMAENFMRGMFGHRDNLPKAYVRQGLEDVSPESLVAWKALTTAMADDDHEELPAAIRACLDVDSREGQELFAGFPMPRAVVEAALRKWDDREVTLGFEPGRSNAPKP
ncbi:hypothetical protein OIU34_19970 [Pararhizobium sp. BT-229]|uniref:hypothetical protein n=1 Tax=Pararhizobium sp. BT-229 TaxID=2986923 RepID=UPI0021F74237|nr:hypothetical protein [Pararhizobium sp. BT-229]MCV9964164.1 hypothetical protein [Pararhizobium sp. BT-229]